MILTIFNKNGLSRYIEDVHHITLCSTKAIVITFKNDKEEIIEQEDYEYFGVHP